MGTDPLLRYSVTNEVTFLSNGPLLFVYGNGPSNGSYFFVPLLRYFLLRYFLLRYSVTPLLRYSVTPLLRYSVTPLLRYSVTPLLRYFVTPLLHYSIHSIVLLLLIQSYHRQYGTPILADSGTPIPSVTV